MTVARFEARLKAVTIKVLDRPTSGDALEERQKRWDEAISEKRFLQYDEAIAYHRAWRRRKVGSRRSRALFEERVVARARAKWTARMAVVQAELQAVGELFEFSVTDFREDAKYSTLTVFPLEPCAFCGEASCTSGDCAQALEDEIRGEP